jgi:hypothetical protein
MKMWSKLQREIYNLLMPDVKLQIHCVAYRMASAQKNNKRAGVNWGGNTLLPRYWITLEREIIWDYPKDFMEQEVPYSDYKGERMAMLKEIYPYTPYTLNISNLFRQYIDTPKDLLLDTVFDGDKWGLTDILKAADRRVGKGKLAAWRATINSSAVDKILVVRL